MLLTRIGLSLDLFGAILLALELLGHERVKAAEQYLREFIRLFTVKNWFHTVYDHENTPKVKVPFVTIAYILGPGSYFLFFFLFKKYAVPWLEQYYLSALWLDFLRYLKNLSDRYWLWVIGLIFFVWASWLFAGIRHGSRQRHRYSWRILGLIGLAMLPLTIMALPILLLHYVLYFLLIVSVFAVLRLCYSPFVLSFWFQEKLKVRSALLFSGIVFLVLGYVIQFVATF